MGMMSNSVATALGSLAADFWNAYLETEPQHATLLGEPGLDGRLPDRSARGLETARAAYAGLLARLDALPGAGPGTSTGERMGTGAAVSGDAITRSALRDAIEEQLTLVDSGILAWNVDPLDGIPVQLLNTADFQPTSTPDDRTALLERWRAMGRFVDDHIASLRDSLARGVVASRAPVDRVIDILAEQLARPDTAWPLMVPVAGVDAALRDEIRPAFARLHRVLVEEIRPAARPDERPGLCHVPDGDSAYRQLARMHTSLEIAPEELHRIGLAEVERIDAEIEALTARVLGSRDRRAASTALRGDPALHFTSRDEVFEKAAASLDRATEAIPAWFGRLPQARCEVVRMGAHEEEHSTIAYYRMPAEDGSRPGQYYINTAHPETRPRYEAEALAYHEAVPGHHLQIAIAQELDGLPAFRRHLGTNAFAEGWGLYVERLADEMGLYSGDVDRIGVLSFDAWRASRLVVDTGLHALGWTRRQAIEFMVDHTVLAENNIVNEVDRYIVLPGQALSYKVGQLELLRLRAEARERLGTAFDIRAFHDTVLGNGAVGLPTLRAIVEAWAALPAVP